MKDKSWFEDRVESIRLGIKHPTNQRMQQDAESALCELAGQVLFDLHKLTNKEPESLVRRKGD